MLSPAQVLRLPYDPSLTLAGIEYAKKSLHYTYNRMGLDSAARLRKIVAGVAVELAFRRWLEAQAVPYDLLGATAFTDTFDNLPQASVPTFVWDQIASGTNASLARAWAGALTLILIVMLLNVTARLLARFNRVK